MTDPIVISYSQARTFRKCEQEYKYGYIDKLRPKVRFAPMELGTVIHDYFERYYGGVSSARNATKDAVAIHRNALRATLRKAKPEIEGMAAIAADAGADEQAQALLQIIPTARALLTAYHRVHGEDDASAHRVVLVEEDFETRLANGVRLTGRIDMVTEDDRGYWLWEHKTTGNVPPVRARMRDLQTAIYKPVLRNQFDIDITGIIWNNIHTTPPRPPNINQNGKMSTAACVTTEELALATIAKAELGDYDGFLDAVRRRERETMFPRYELAGGQDTDLLMADMRRTARRIVKARERGTDWQAVRNIDTHCDWCSMLKLCQGVIAGGDDALIRKMHYTAKEPRNVKDKRNAGTRRRAKA